MGHENGTLVVIHLPSGEQRDESKRRMRQLIFDDLHRGQAVVEVAWADGGRRLYSGDETGLLLEVEVDFDEVGLGF